MSGAVNVVKKGLDVVREVTGGTYDAIGKVAQKVGNTVEAILENPKQLAAVAISMAFPAAAPSIGNWILGAELAATIGAAGTAAVGNMCLNTAMNGGDVGQAVKTTALQYAGNIGSEKLTEIVKNADIVPDAFAKNVGTTTTYAAIQAAQGKDATVALLTGGANACAQILVQEVPGFSEMPPQAQAAITKATASALQGKSGGAINAAIDYATNFVKDEYKTYKEANDNGFGYNADTWRDAKSIGITNPQDYQYAKTIGADNPYDLQIGKAIGAKDNSDLTLAKDIGLSTSDDFNYAKQVGVNNKEDFSLAKDIGAQNALDIDFAKQLGIDTSNDFNYARNIGATTANDYDLAKTIGIKDATDFNVAKQFGITDKDTFDKYSDFLGHGTEKASTSTIRGIDGTELTVDNEGNLVNYTYQTDDGKKDITDEVENVARRAGGYTLRGDDGSTITINEDGTVSATDALEGFYDAPGVKRPPVSYAKLLGTAAKNRAVTQQTEQGGVNEATAKATQLARSGRRELTADDLMGLLMFMGGDEQQYYTPTATQEGGESQLAQIEPTGPSNEDINFLGNLGGRPSYLGSLEREQPTEGAQVEPGRDAGAASRGAVFGPPVGAGGGGAGFDRYTSSGPVNPFGGGAGYGRSSSSDIIKTLQSAGLQDQSDAETQRLLNAQGPVAIGRIPPPAPPAGKPASVAAPAAPAATALSTEQDTRGAQAPAVDPLQQLQEYAAMMARSGKSGAGDLFDMLRNQKVFYNPMTGSYQLMDRRINK
jgi:hypothetical protein